MYTIISTNLIVLVLERIILLRMFFRKSLFQRNFLSSRLSESETKTTMHMFSDHAGVIIDRFGVGNANENIPHVTTIPELRGVRISPRQSPKYQPMVTKRINQHFEAMYFSFSLVDLWSNFTCLSFPSDPYNMVAISI